MVDVHGSEGIVTYYEQIGELEEKLRDKGFFRCHKSYLINLKYVDVYNRQEVIHRLCRYFSCSAMLSGLFIYGR